MKKCHFIGIGGIGMSGLARLLLNQKIAVSGSDIASSPIIDSLSNEGVKFFLGHSSTCIEPDMSVIYTTDIKKDNPEYLEAKRLNCPMLHRSELLRILMNSYQSLAVAGTHGKTTTSSLLAWTLECCGQSPTYAIGGVAPQLSSNSKKGSGQFFVAEACESDGTFLNYTPYGAIVTNIDKDHMDFFQTEKSLIEAFNKFIENTSSEHLIFWCGEDVYLQKLNPKGISYGFEEKCKLKGSKFKQKGWISSFDIDFEEKHYKDVEVSLIGKHNALNALSVFGLAIKLGLEEKKIREALRTFQGVLRRCEKKGESHGILFLDDYAHHPTELKAVLKAIRQSVGERRIVVAYQPHRYTRTRDCRGMYGGIFKEADALFITEVYGAGEVEIPGITHKEMLAEVQVDLKDRCKHVSRLKLAATLAEFLRPHDVLISLGAGDITKLSGEILEHFAFNSPSKIKVGLIFGGASVEHEISLISSATIYPAMNPDFYEIEQFGITRKGTWLKGSGVREILENQKEFDNPLKISGEILTELMQCDILFPILHGTFGEDGTIQGFFEMLSKAYVGCDYRSSANCMDKVLTKRLAMEAGIAALPFLSFTKCEWEANPEFFIAQINSNLFYPLFVKPAHLGSSFGVSKVKETSLLSKAIKEAFRSDTLLIVESGVENVREIEFSVLGNIEPFVFPPGEVLTEGNVHDFDSKYGLNPDKPAARYDIVAKLPKEKIEEGRKFAKACYKTLGCSGMARVDTFLDVSGNFWLNEINPIPGFTKNSLYPLMCNENGLPLRELLDQLIVFGLHRRRHLDRLEL